MDALNEYFQKKVDEMGSKKVSFGVTVSEGINNAIAGSDLGTIISGIQNGESIWAILIKLILSVVSELESFQKAINIISEAIRKAIKYIEPLVNKLMPVIDELINNLADDLAPLLAIITSIINGALKPILQIINEVLEILKPFIDLFVEFYNVIATVVNQLAGWAGVELELIEFTESVKDATDEMEKQTTLLQKKYERQAQAVEDLLQSQLESLRSQYELGLISREQYESQAEKYAADADSKIYDINKQMEEHLKNIETYTAAALTEEQKAKAEARGKELPLIDNLLSPITGLGNDIKDGDVGGIVAEVLLPGIGGAVKDNAEEGNWGAVVGDVLTGGLGSLFGWWDVGSYNIPQDQFGMVHKGEIIVPRTFAEGIRSGELTLGSNRTSNNAINVNVVVTGSVKTEKELVSTIYNGIAAGIQTREFQPLAGA